MECTIAICLLLQMVNPSLFQYMLIHCWTLLVVKSRDYRTNVTQVDSKGKTKLLAINVEEFETMKNYMFITTRTVSGEFLMFCQEQLLIHWCSSLFWLFIKIKARENKPHLVNQLCMVYCFKCDLCDGGYVGYTFQYLYPQIVEHRQSAIGNHLRDQHNQRPDDIGQSFTIWRINLAILFWRKHR